MNILIVEDAEYRIVIFREMFKGHNLVITGEPKEAINLLKTKKWDMLFLDHDLYGQIHVPSGDGTGWEVAKFIADTGLKYAPNKVYLHSHNERGVKNMKELLPWAKQKWFGLFSFDGKEIVDIEKSRSIFI